LLSYSHPKELTFVGDILSSEGIRPDPQKVSAIENMPRPQCKKDVQSEKRIEWEWNHEHEKAWRDLKDLLTKEPVLKFYDPMRPIKISSDASQSGLGAVLLQKYDEWQPVAYASRSMTDAETRYAQIEKELLSITAAAEMKLQLKSPANRDRKEKTCGRCGMQHPPKKCPAYGKRCNTCNKNNHYARCCKAQTLKQSAVHTVDEEDTEELYVAAVTDNKTGEKDWIMTL
uniref:Reverse transcriptase/retrotransposon-derived protein RNase H-like domain-containing protein n=1 Tax=Pundamilia nyererei TaxID=303518 RepID=A0A3B4HBD3_9CICH